MAFGSTQNCKVIGIFCLANSKLEHLEVCSSSVKSNIPIPLLRKTTSTSSKQVQPEDFPNLSLVIDEFQVTVSYEKISWSSTWSNVKVNHNKIENKSEISVDEIAVNDDKGNVVIHEFKWNRRNQAAILATWSHISVQSSVETLDSINFVRMKYFDMYQGTFKRRYMEDTTLIIEISGGTFESTLSNVALHVQQIISKVGQLEQGGNNFYLDNFHLDFDKEQNEVAGTVANIGMALCEESLSIVFEWCSSFLSMKQNNSSSSSSKFNSVKWGLRSQSIQVDFTLENNLSCQLVVESSKSKGQGSLKGIGCKGLSLVLKEPSDSEEISIIAVSF